MKKLMSIALVCVMLLSAFATLVSADDKYTGDPESGYGLVQEVQAYTLPTAPTFDFDSKGNPSNETITAAGAIDRTVWGEPTVVAKATDANTAFTTEPNGNVLFAFDRAFDELYHDEETKDTAAYTENGSWEKISYRLWLAWDNDYYYIAAEIDDPDGYSLKTGSQNIWDGDCLQFRLDPLGPNGVMKYANFDYDYSTECFDWWKYREPWYNLNNVMNIGVGDVVSLKRNEFQVVDMSPAEGGTIISDPKTGRGIKFNIVNANKNTVNPGMTVLQIALPWSEILNTAAYAGNISAENIGVGYVLGMSATVLNANASEFAGSWNSYLNWGSGVTGASMESTAPWFPYVNPGSNAVVLNGNSALDHSAAVEGARVAEPIKPVEHVDKVLFCDLGDFDNQINSGETLTYNVEAGIAAAADIAITAEDPTDNTRSLVGWWIGDSYSVYAGYDISSKTFVVAEQKAGDGINRDIIYKRSDLTYDWQLSDPDADKPAEWKRMGIKIVGDKVELYLDGAKVLECENPRIGHHIVGAEEAEETGVAVGTVTDALINQQFLINNTAACVIDNYIAGTPDYNLKGDENGDGKFDEAKATSFLFQFTFDSDDPEWNASPMRSVESRVARIDYKPLDKEGDAYYAEKASGSIVPPPFTPADANGDGKINNRDTILVMKAVLAATAGSELPSGLVFEAADMDGNGKLNNRDVIAVMKAVLAAQAK